MLFHLIFSKLFVLAVLLDAFLKNNARHCVSGSIIIASPYNPPVKNQDFKIRVALENISSPGSFKSAPTLAAGDFKIDKDGGGLNNLATLPTNVPAASVCVLIELSDTEMNADVVTIVCIDQTSPKEWADLVISIPTTQ